MKQKDKVVLGIYKNRSEVESAVHQLKFKGFGTEKISVLMPEYSREHALVHVKRSKAPQCASVGAGAGALIGGTLGLLAGVGAIALSGFGPLIAAGPIMLALAGMGAGGTLGGVGGTLIGLGLPEYQVKIYEGMIHQGGILLSVHTESALKTSDAKKSLEFTGARDISTMEEQKSEPDFENFKFFPDQSENTVRRASDLLKKKDIENQISSSYFF